MKSTPEFIRIAEGPDGPPVTFATDAGPATKLIATHDLELVVELCSRAIVLDHGSVVADGPAIELLDDEALMIAHGLERPHILRHHHPH